MSDELDQHDVFDKLKEECGVFAVYGHPEASNLAYLGLYAYDNTLCYLTGFRRFHPDAGPR